mmetsp:Transcript_20641/g.34726  ORF Transcript_20641/g.34726 Transcript_20641/m.34726 type:complete len:465 (-) Transcript_20641:867-2261(-)
MMLRILSRAKALRKVQSSSSMSSRFFSQLPEHILVPMPALSPTMETGSISNWLLNEGDAFEAGQAICEVETDKATVTYDATDDGYIAKILVGSGEIEVGTPLMVTVEDSSYVSSFANYTANSSSTPPSSTEPEQTVFTQQQTDPVQSEPIAKLIPVEGRVIASPLARRLARDAQVDMARISSAGYASGPGGRVLGADVLEAVSSGALTQTVQASVEQLPDSAGTTTSIPDAGGSGEVYTSFQQSDSSSVSSTMGSMYSQSKKEVPHYYLSVEVNVSSALSMKDSFGDSIEVSLQDILIKAAAKSMEKVPAVNAAWMDSFVRQYEQVDVNLIVGEGSSLRAPVLRNVGAKGLSRISEEVRRAQEDETVSSAFESGTFTIHNLGLYGVQSAAAIVLPPQACALSIGAVVDTVVPNSAAQDGEEAWKVAPILVCTLSCDHRVIDGAVGAGWLKAFKEYVENPLTLLL